MSAVRLEPAAEAERREADIEDPVDGDEDHDDQHQQERDHPGVAALADDLGGTFLGQANGVCLLAGREPFDGTGPGRLLLAA